MGGEELVGSEGEIEVELMIGAEVTEGEDIVGNIDTLLRRTLESFVDEEERESDGLIVSFENEELLEGNEDIEESEDPLVLMVTLGGIMVAVVDEGGVSNGADNGSVDNEIVWD